MKWKHIVSSVFGFGGVTELVRRTNSLWRPERFCILMYHRLRCERGATDLLYQGNIGPTVRTFERQMRYLQKCYTVISFDQLIEGLQENASIPQNAVVISFDDGYKDTYTLAYPILKKYGLPATVFLATGHIGTEELLWYDRVAYILRQTRRKEINLIGFYYPLLHLADRFEATERIVQALKIVSEEEKCLLIEKLKRACEVTVDGHAVNSGLSWDEVREMARNGITFGAHTVTHPILTRVSREVARAEIIDSKTTIENKLQKPVRFFAYPNGELTDFNEDIQHMVRELGFDAACTTIFGPDTAIGDRFALRRLGISSDDSLPILKANLAGIFPLISHLKRAIRPVIAV